MSERIMFNALDDPFHMVETTGGRLVTATKDFATAKKIAGMLNELNDAAYQAGREEALQEIDRLAGEIGDMEVWRSTDLRTTGLQAGWIAEAEEWEINVSGTNLTEALRAAANQMKGEKEDE